MPRKKINDDENEIAAAANLRDDEVIEIHDTRTIGKSKRPSKQKEPEPIEVEEETDAELVEEFDFPAGTIGALLNRSDDENYQDQQATILIVRKPDSAGEKFANPCPARLNLAPLRNVELTRPQDEIEDLLRMTYGGGHYYCQIRIGNQIQSGFSLDVADPPNAGKPEPTPVPSTSPTEPPPPPANPFDSMLESIVKMKTLKDALFGDAEKALEKQIEELKNELREARNNRPEPEPKSESLVILEKALASGNPDLTDRLLDYAFPSNDGSGHWLADAIKTVIEHRAEIGEIVGPMLGVPRPMPPGGVAGILQKQPPAGALPAQTPRSKFTRREPAEAETPSNPDKTVSESDASKNSEKADSEK